MGGVGQGGRLVPSCAEKLLSLEGAWSRGPSLAPGLGLPISVGGVGLGYPQGASLSFNGQKASLVPATPNGLQPRSLSTNA